MREYCWKVNETKNKKKTPEQLKTGVIRWGKNKMLQNIKIIIYSPRGRLSSNKEHYEFIIKKKGNAFTVDS